MGTRRGKPTHKLHPTEHLCDQIADRLTGVPAVGAVLVDALKAGC